MAEISTLTPSPPALVDSRGAPAIPPPSATVLVPEPTKEVNIPKSCLYNDKALIRNTPETPATEGSPLVSQTLMQAPPPSSPNPQSAGVVAKETEPPSKDETQSEAVVGNPTDAGIAPMQAIKQKSSDPGAGDLPNATPESPAQLKEPSAQSAVQHESLSHSLNPGPNLYPSVHVTHNPNLSIDDAQFTMAEPQTNPVSDLIPAPKGSNETITVTSPIAAAVAEEQNPLLPQQAPNPQTPSPNQSPKPDTPSEAWKDEVSITPCRAEHPSPPVPVIHEPTFPMPSPKPRPAPDTLSYLESASLMSGTLESLSGLGEDGSSVGSDSEINGLTVRRTDKYGFLGGSQYSESSDKEVRVEVARQREMKWIDMFNNWDKWVKHRFQKVKIRCRKGIPSSLRAKAWQLLSNSEELLNANPRKFEELEREQGEAKWLDIIEKDLHRQFPFHEMFAARGGHGQQDLYRILKAYTIYRPEEGYCQAQAPVAAVLLMHMPAEQAFWCLVQICEKYLPGYYSAGLEAIQLDGEIFFSLLRRTCPMAYRHLKKFKIDPILYMTEWFMCIFSRTLPWSCVLRVWDMFFCEGVKIVFRVGLVLLRQMLGSVDKLRELQGMYETMERLRNISPDSVREDTLVQEIVSLPVTEALIERECSIQVRKWRESRGELTHQPGRRLHGTRAIHEHKRRAAAISSGGSFSFLGSSIPPPGPLRASSSLLSLTGLRKAKSPFHTQTKKGSFSGPFGVEGLSLQPHSAAMSSPRRAPMGKPPIPVAHFQYPLVGAALGRSSEPAQTIENTSTQGQPGASVPTQHPPTNLLSPSPKIVSEQIMPTIPSPTANNAPLPPCPDPKKEAAAATAGEDEGKKKKKSKENKKKEKVDEKQKLKEKKEKEKAEKKEKERLEKEKKKEKAGKKKDKGGGEAEEKNGAAAPNDLA
ncbi:TBC1 domain family member 10B-like [Lampris incognitus]|uniref:TBC1 domain family member 10B-like n=1 Tax=Lampris incognitus TaxID=2546036 RepID=UPI0024B57D14|nr:TBC1 domain family member 10B-like [Lampris incognitus]